MTGDKTGSFNLTTTGKGTFGGFEVILANTDVKITEKEFFAGALILPEIQFTASNSTQIGIIRRGLYIMDASAPTLLFASDDLAKSFQIRADFPNNEIEFVGASGGYIFDNDITTTGDVTAGKLIVTPGNSIIEYGDGGAFDTINFQSDSTVVASVIFSTTAFSNKLSFNVLESIVQFNASNDLSFATTGEV